MKRVLIAPAAVAIAIAAVMTGGGGALAAGPANPSFETGDTTGWTEVLGESGSTGVESGQGLPGTGAFSGAVYGGDEDVPTELRQSVTLAVGETISGWVRFEYRDGPCETYNDGGALFISGPSGDAFMLDASGCSTGSTDWIEWSYTASTAATYAIVAQSWNGGDGSVASVLLLDAFVFEGFARGWTFGDCDDSEGCRGFGIIIGEVNDPTELLGAIQVALEDDLYAPYHVLSAYAFKVGGGGTQFVPPIFYTGGEETCESLVPAAVPDQREILTADQSAGSGFWITWFQIGENCEPV